MLNLHMPEMRIVSKKTITTYYSKHREADVSLCDWYRKTSKARWYNFAQVKTTYSSADYVGNKRIVFNIGGGKYRLIAFVWFKAQTVFIRFIGTHAEYDNIADIQNI